MGIVCEKWTPRRSNTLHGFADVLLEQTHLRIRDVALHQKGEHRWAQLPARPMIDRDGVALRNDQGKVQYGVLLQFTDRAAGDEFSRGVIAAVLERFPRAFDGAEQ